MIVVSLGGDAHRAVLLGRARVGTPGDAAAWLRGEALRLAVRLDPGPRTRWAAAPGLVRPAYAQALDAPTAMREWAECAEQARAVRALLAEGHPYIRRFQDPGGSWYELNAAPAENAGIPMNQPSPDVPRCEATGQVTQIVAELAQDVTRTPGGAPRARVRCALAPHLTYEHQGIVRELSGEAGHVWGTFGAAVPVWRVRVAPPCPHWAGALRCGLYEDHPGACVPARPSEQPV
ncbi:formylmethionine deformylase [Streptomyces sp. SID11385]|uniref:formylmethionine deformylase n=1 Tax=Streptomyces sp. SID11385 TaxID=2706031 RepID=UPI0013CD5763|nr:formylmethionine deformylase [Streptomyces sp. SID11385]